MTKQEMEKYKDKKPIATYCMSNWGGIEILDVEYGADDYIIWRYNFGKPEDILHRAKVQHSVQGYSFIRVSDARIRLDACMRV